MAFRLRFSSRSLREIGEAQEWYEAQSAGLGEEFISALELQIKRLVLALLLYAEIIRMCAERYCRVSHTAYFYGSRGFDTGVGGAA
jgi:hypothetical protein